MKRQGIVGTSSPLILTATVHFGNGVSGMVYVGQSIIDAILTIKRTMESQVDDNQQVWNVGVWDTRLVGEDGSVANHTGGTVPNLGDVKRISDALDDYLLKNR